MPQNTCCAKCQRPFGENARLFTSSSGIYGESPFCRGCVGNCQDSEIADHWCAVDRWRAERVRAAR